MSPEEEFQLEQYRAMRKEIDNNIAEVRLLQRYSLIAVAVVWSWIATNSSIAPDWAAFTPLIFVALGSSHTWSVLGETRDAGLFIATTTERFFCSDSSVKAFGWENWLRRVQVSQRTKLYNSTLDEIRRAYDKPRPHISHNPLHTWRVWSLWLTLTVMILIVGVYQVQHKTVAEIKNSSPCLLNIK